MNRYRTAAIRYLWCLLFIALAGLVLRLLHIRVIYYSLMGDMPTYLDNGEKWFFKPTYVTQCQTTGYPPGYIIYLIIIRLISGWQTIRPIMWSQAFVDSLSIVFVGMSARMLYGARAGIISAIVFALYTHAILTSGQIMTECLTMFFLSLSIMMFLLYLERPCITRVVMAAIIFAIGMHFRNVILLVILAFVFCDIHKRLKIKRTGQAGQSGYWQVIKPTVIVFVIVMLGLVPFTIRNSLILKRFVFFTSWTAFNIIPGANPNSDGNFTGWDGYPERWEKLLDAAPDPEKELVAGQLVGEFLTKTHTAYYLLRVIPNKVRSFFWDDMWHYAGQGVGGPLKLPFGPRIRFPLVGSTVLAVLGMTGLLIVRGRRHRWLPFFLWLLLFLPNLLLPINPRYRYMSELPLVFGAGAAINLIFFYKTPFIKRLRLYIIIYAVISLLWTGTEVLCSSGRNILNNERLYATNEPLKNMVQGRYVIDHVNGNKTDNITISNININPGRWAFLTAEFKCKISSINNFPYGTYGPFNNPSLGVEYAMYDDRGTTVTVNPFTKCRLNRYHRNGAWLWQVIPLHGNARTMSLFFTVSGAPGKVEIYDFQARCPIWQ
ncbi:MAG: hypothetical protein NTY46_16835 [Candidatus Sumerlaeota bacterium]|nr:hypothetical protein [Candidatus Sumerlaeota bacterium]